MLPAICAVLAIEVFALPAAGVGDHGGALLNALPTGTGPFMLAEFYGRDVGRASRVMFVTTILSLVSVPACIRAAALIQASVVGPRDHRARPRRVQAPAERFVERAALVGGHQHALVPPVLARECLQPVHDRAPEAAPLVRGIGGDAVVDGHPVVERDVARRGERAVRRDATRTWPHPVAATASSTSTP